jgi:hypothetical protein
MINPLNGCLGEGRGRRRRARPHPTANQPIVPWVLDRKNALLLQLAEP